MLFILLLKMFQLWSLGAPSVDSYVSLSETPTLCVWKGVYVLSPSLLSGARDTPGSLCIFRVPILESAFSPRSPGFFYWRIKDLGTKFNKIFLKHSFAVIFSVLETLNYFCYYKILMLYSSSLQNSLLV